MKKLYKKLLLLNLIFLISVMFIGHVKASEFKSNHLLSDRVSEQSKEIGVELSTSNFPDNNFRKELAVYDIDKNNFLSNDELNLITTLKLSAISNLEGVKILQSLQQLTISHSSVVEMNLRGMTSITTIDFRDDNPNLKKIDLRECINLVSAAHAVKDEVVLISPGMTKYEACPYNEEHTGNIIIDLCNAAIPNPDGTKTINLTQVISSKLLNVFKKNNQPGYDPLTNVLTIPNGTHSEYVAGTDINGSATSWTFYVDYDNPALPDVGENTIVQYLDEAGNKISEDTIKTGNIGDSYELQKKDIEGYTFKEVAGDMKGLLKVDDNLFGVFTDQERLIKCIYTKVPPAVGENTIVQYLDEAGNKISEDTIKTGNIGDSYELQKKDIEGYTFKEVAGDMKGLLKVDDNLFGVFTDQERLIKCIYTKVPPAVGENTIVQYLDEAGNKISEDTIKTGNIGDSYELQKKDIEGYTFKEVAGDMKGLLKVDDNLFGVFTDQERLIKCIYTKVPPAVGENTIVQYLDEAGNKISEDTIKTGNIGDSYELQKKATKDLTPVASKNVNKFAILDKVKLLPKAGDSQQLIFIRIIIGILLLIIGVSLVILKKKNK